MAEIQGPGDNPWDVDFNDLYDLEEIGGGNFGKVYKAKLNHLDVAIKQLYDIDDEFMFKYIEREMALLKEMRHPNIVKFLGLCKSDEGDIFIVTEYVPGGDLRHILKDKNFPLPWKLRISIAMDLAKALQYLHSQGIIHRDVKSNNLLVEEDWTIKVCDFGFARDIDKSTESMTLCGTDEWMAPEVALGEKYDAKADVFSFGMVIVELITRKKPPLRQPGRAFAFDTEKFRASVPSDCPQDFTETALLCGTWNPENRPDWKDILAVLNHLFNSLPKEKYPSVLGESQSLSSDMTYMSVAVEEGSDDEEDSD